MVVMFLSTVANVVARYVFNSPIEWAEELSRYAFIWLVFLGSAACTKRKRHIAIDNLVQVLPDRVRAPFVVVADLATLALMGILLAYGWKLMVNATQATATLAVPKSVVYAVVPFAAALILVYTLTDLWRDLGLLWHGGREA